MMHIGSDVVISLRLLTVDNINNVPRQAAETMESIVDFGRLDLESYSSSQSRDISDDGKFVSI